MDATPPSLYGSLGRMAIEPDKKAALTGNGGNVPGQGQPVTLLGENPFCFATPLDESRRYIIHVERVTEAIQ